MIFIFSNTDITANSYTQITQHNTSRRLKPTLTHTPVEIYSEQHQTLDSD